MVGQPTARRAGPDTKCRARKNLAIVKSAAALLQPSSKDGPHNNFGDVFSAQKIAQKPTATRVLGFSSSTPKLSPPEPRQLTTPSPSKSSQRQTQPLKRRASRERIICDKEKALIAAYKAAAQLLGAAEGDLTLTPLRNDSATSKGKTNLSSAEEQALKLEKALQDKIKALELQIEAIRQKGKAIEKKQDKHIADLDRCLFNAQCGLELMSDLAKEARQDACQRAVQFMDMRLKSDTPSLIRVINDELLVNTHASTLDEADALIEKHGKKKNVLSMELPPQRPYVPTGAIF